MNLQFWPIRKMFFKICHWVWHETQSSFLETIRETDKKNTKQKASTQLELLYTDWNTLLVDINHPTTTAAWNRGIYWAADRTYQKTLIDQAWVHYQRQDQNAFSFVERNECPRSFTDIPYTVFIHIEYNRHWTFLIINLSTLFSVKTWCSEILGL